MATGGGSDQLVAAAALLFLRNETETFGYKGRKPARHCTLLAVANAVRTVLLSGLAVGVGLGRQKPGSGDVPESEPI